MCIDDVVVQFSLSELLIAWNDMRDCNPGSVIVNCDSNCVSNVGSDLKSSDSVEESGNLLMGKEVSEAVVVLFNNIEFIMDGHFELIKGLGNLNVGFEFLSICKNVNTKNNGEDNENVIKIKHHNEEKAGS